METIIKGYKPYSKSVNMLNGKQSICPEKR